MAIRNLLKHIIGCVTSACTDVCECVCVLVCVFVGLFAFGAATFESQTQKKGVETGGLRRQLLS